MRFDGQADVLFIVWNDRPGKPREVRYARKNLLSVTGFMGNTIESKSTGAREAQLPIDESAGPIYLLWKRASDS
jgi:hypothetical protein